MEWNLSSPAKKTNKSLGVCKSTFRRWSDNVTPSSIRMPGGQRLYSLGHLLRTNRHPSTSGVNETRIT